MPDETANQPTDAPAAETKTAPPWGDDFDAERAWKLVQNLRADNEKKTAKLHDFEKAAADKAEAEKTELERAIARAEKAEKSLADRDAAERRKAVLDKHGLDETDAAFLLGVADDELDAKAEALATRLGVSKKDAAEEIPGKPKPKLLPGHATGDAEPDFDPIALADSVRKGF